MRPTSKDKAGSRRQSSCATLPFATPTETSLQGAPPALHPLSPRKGQSASASMGQQLGFERNRLCQRALFPSCLQMGVKSPCLLWPGEGLHISTVGNNIPSLPPGLLCPAVPPVTDSSGCPSPSQGSFVILGAWCRRKPGLCGWWACYYVERSAVHLACSGRPWV